MASPRVSRLPHTAVRCCTKKCHSRVPTVRRVHVSKTSPWRATAQMAVDIQSFVSQLCPDWLADWEAKRGISDWLGVLRAICCCLVEGMVETTRVRAKQRSRRVTSWLQTDTSRRYSPCETAWECGSVFIKLLMINNCFTCLSS